MKLLNFTRDGLAYLCDLGEFTQYCACGLLYLTSQGTNGNNADYKVW